jgi:bifunctional non-homologous end joining protein LigD
MGALQLTPELATLVDSPPEGPGWFHEPKLDGYRLLAHLSTRRSVRDVSLLTRRGHDWTSRAPAIAKALQTLPVKSAVLDGEMVVLRKDGLSDFQSLQNVLRQGHQAALVFFAFDLLFLDGKDLRSLPLHERKRELASLLRRARSPRIRLTEHIEGAGERVFAQACKLGLEGIVSKRADSPYEGRRTMSWQKSKCSARQELVIGGYTAPAGSRQHLGALLMGVRVGDTLRYAGKVGTGFSERSLRELATRLAPLRSNQTPFVDPPRGAEARDVQWVTPKLVAEVEFTEFTQDHRMRHPSFRGLRDDKRAEEVVEERPKRRSRRGSSGARAKSRSGPPGPRVTRAGAKKTSLRPSRTRSRAASA